MIEFEEVYSEHFDLVYRYILSLCRNEKVAEEVTQETFFKALKNINRFEGNSNIETWLCKIAKNTYFRLYEKDKKKSLQEPEAEKKAIETNFIQQESAFEIHKVLHKMAEPYKEVFTLRTFGELSFRQIGEIFGKTESWARVTYHRAKMKIKEELT